MVDKIVVLNDGNIAEYGTYEELISRGGVFAQFLKSYLDQDAESEQEEDAEGRPHNKSRVMRNPAFCICEINVQIICAVTLENDPSSS